MNKIHHSLHDIQRSRFNMVELGYSQSLVDFWVKNFDHTDQIDPETLKSTPLRVHIPRDCLNKMISHRLPCKLKVLCAKKTDFNSPDKYFVWPRQSDKKSDKKILSGKNPDKNFLSGPDNSLPNSADN